MEVFLEAIPALSSAFSQILQPKVMVYLIMGVCMGLCIGVFPGLGGIAGLSLLLPFMFGMDPILGLALMIGMVAVVPTSDTFASVLMGIPGSSASQATVLDGFPMAKRGKAARALSAAFASSLFGGLVGAAFLTIFILVARPVVLLFKSPELLMVSIFGLSMVGILAGRIAIKGVVAAGLGLLVGTIGEGPFNGELRMASYDFPYLTDGLKLVIVGLGIFAIPEIIALLRQDKAISERSSLGGGWLDGVKDWWTYKWLSMRCSLIGVTVGVIPGLGGSVVDWIAYGHTVQTSKDKSLFGNGDVRGVIPVTVGKSPRLHLFNCMAFGFGQCGRYDFVHWPFRHDCAIDQHSLRLACAVHFHDHFICSISIGSKSDGSGCTLCHRFSWHHDAAF